MSSFNQGVLVAVTVGALCALSGVATAQTDEWTVKGAAYPTAAVGYADLNLASPAGEERLRARVRRAATELCIDSAVRELKRDMRDSRCLHLAIAGADPQIAAAIDGYGKDRLATRRIMVAAR